METSRKRKLSDSAEASSCRDPARVSNSEGGSPHSSNTTALQYRRLGHTYSDFEARDHSRNHLGDNITVNNYGRSPSSEEKEAEQRRNFMRALSFDRMDLRRAAIDPTCGRTCQWIFEHEQYLRWRDSSVRDSHDGFFWIQGKPGSGKSTLLKCILERLHRDESGCMAISFFFNARGVPLERTIEGCYRSLLHQIFERRPECLDSLRLPSNFKEGQSWELAILRDIFRNVVLDLNNQPLTLVIDALDECDEVDIRDMVEFISRLTQTVQSLNICFASRHYPRISIQRCEGLILEHVENHDHDILEYVLRELRFNTEQEKARLVQQITGKAHGVFMWVVLVVRILNKQFDRGASPRQLLASIDTLPGALDSLIGNIISGEGLDAYLLPALLWTLAGIPNMSTREMYNGILLGAGNLCSTLEDAIPVDESTMLRFITHSSRGLVEAVPIGPRNIHHSFQFIHESVRQHILAGNLGKFNPSLSYNVEASSHAMLGAWCLSYTQLRFPNCGFQIDPANGKVAWEQIVAEYEDDDARCTQMERVEAEFPFLSYAYYNAFDHLDRACAGNSYDVRLLCDFPLHDWISISNVFMDEGYFYYLSTASLTHVILESLMETDKLLKALMELYCLRSNTAETEDRNGNAVDNVSSRLFLGQSLDAYCGGYYGTLLIAAAAQGRAWLVKRLLDCGADPNTVGTGIGLSGKSEGCGVTALAVAAERQQNSNETTEIISSLLSGGADIDARTIYAQRGQFGSALASAALKGYVDNANLLLSRGANVHLKSPRGDNIALSAALVTSSNRNMVALLLAHGACDGPEVATMLVHDVAAHCQIENMKTLVRLGADPHSRDLHLRTTLHAVARAGPYTERADRTIMATFLIELGVEIDAVDRNRNTALILASVAGHDELVRLFLERGAASHGRSDEYGSAIEAARRVLGVENSSKAANYAKIIEMLSAASMNSLLREEV